MYYFTPDTIAEANEQISSIDAKIGGLLCILSCLDEEIEENLNYTINGPLLRKRLSIVFDKAPKEQFDNAKSSYIIFAKNWGTTFFNHYIKNKIDLTACAVFFLRRHGFEREYNAEEVIDTFVKRFNLQPLVEQWFFKKKSITLEYNQINVEENQIKFYSKMKYNGDFKSILFKGVIQKSAADLKAAGQIQTLYSGSGVQTCFLLSDEPLDKYYVMRNSNTSVNEKTNNTSVNPENLKSKAASNILLYGVPGCGKSHTIKTEYCDDETHMERAVFHPDYTYSDFVGQILPKVEGEKVKYEFTPGPFTRIMKKANKNPSEMFYLVIEEINRGNAPAIFGDIFQLLDRDENGISEYGVSNANVAKEVYGDEEIKVKIPGNLYVLATMNTSDQNVFTLDTAFKRRWSLKRIENVIDGSKYADIEICSFGVTWGTFAKTINRRIVELSESNFGNEDNRLGAYFVYPADLEDAERFGEKVLMYLWNDAFKLDRERVFKSEYRTLDELLDGFYEVGLKVFCDDITFEMTTGSSSNDNLTDENYLERFGSRFPECAELYKKLLNDLRMRIPSVKAYGVGSNGYVYWTADEVHKKGFVDLLFKKDGLHLTTETPTDPILINVGRQMDKDNHHKHYYEIVYNKSEHNQVLDVLVDAYNQMKSSQD